MANRAGPSAGPATAQRPNGATQSKICQFKLVLLGESAVGKSSLVLRFVKGQFHEYQESTIGGDVRFFLHLLEYKRKICFFVGGDVSLTFFPVSSCFLDTDSVS